MDNRKKIHDLLAENKLIAVVGTAHIKTEEDAVEMAKALRRGGSKVIEFVLRNGNATDIVNAEVFAAIKKACPDMLIGVGTCATPEDVQRAKDSGADFGVSATFDWDSIEKANKLDMFFLPGAGSLKEFNDLIKGHEKSPYSDKTAHDLLGGKGIATFKVHPGGSTDLIDVINSTIMNDYQEKQGNIKFVDLEPSELAEKNFGLAEIGEFAKKAHVTMLGGTYPYSLPDDKGGLRNLIQEKNWDGISALTAYAMAVTHGEPAPELPDDVKLAAPGKHAAKARKER